MLIGFLFFFLFFCINILCLSVCEFLINCEYLFISKRLNRKIWEVYQNWKKNGEQLQIGFSVLCCCCCCCSGVKNPYKKCTKFALEKFLMCVCVVLSLHWGFCGGSELLLCIFLFCNLADFVHNSVKFFFFFKTEGREIFLSYLFFS